METPERIARLWIVGGHLALDLANTVDGGPDGEPGFDVLWGYGDLVAWSRRVGLLGEDRARRLVGEAAGRADEAGAVYTRALQMRGAIYETFRAVAEGRDPPPDGLDLLRRFECEALARGRLVPTGERFDWEWPDEGDLDGMLWPVAHAATGLLTSGRLDRLKRCAACRWLFVDASKNRSRRWCAMEDCGTHEKMRRYVAKRAARRGQT